jgi:hypothetical protein
VISVYFHFVYAFKNFTNSKRVLMEPDKLSGDNNRAKEAAINEHHVVSDFVDVMTSPLILSNHWKKPRLPEQMG